jgi:hypothetical protein
MSTISIRVTDTELRLIERAVREESNPYRISRHAVLKKAMRKGLEMMKSERKQK